MKVDMRHSIKLIEKEISILQHKHKTTLDLVNYYREELEKAQNDANQIALTISQLDTDAHKIKPPGE